jgi:hypothetical protein
VIDWRQEGFAAPPVARKTTGPLLVYRAWSGDPQRKWGNMDRPGVCFSLEAVATRWQAEHRYAVMEYGNSVQFITQFEVPTETPYLTGKVHPGERGAVLGMWGGSQIYVLRVYVRRLRIVRTLPLNNDLGFHRVVRATDTTH